MTHQTILQKLNEYLNHEITLAQLVDWAETALIEPDIAPREDADAIMDALMYLAAADSRGFPLTWDIVTSFVERLGGSVRVSVESA
ncbi:MAG: hypothetical protein IT320_05420 [Anaerolineae bacterium]|nr:hypothetical protein [Anaerolineae bacterium]